MCYGWPYMWWCEACTFSGRKAHIKMLWFCLGHHTLYAVKATCLLLGMVLQLWNKSTMIIEQSLPISHSPGNKMSSANFKVDKSHRWYLALLLKASYILDGVGIFLLARRKFATASSENISIRTFILTSGCLYIQGINEGRIWYIYSLSPFHISSRSRLQDDILQSGNISV